MSSSNTYDKLAEERLRETKERADKLALENAEKRRDLIPRDEVEEFVTRVFTAFRGRILAAAFEREDKDQILRELGGLLELCHPECKAGLESATADDGQRVVDPV